jgi:hypothetical protein
MQPHNMFTIKEICNSRIANFFLDDPTLANMGLSDEFLAELYYNKEYTPKDNSQFKGFYLGDDLVFVFKYEHFTPVCLNIHCYLSSKLQRSGAFNDIQKILRDWTKENYPNITKVICMTPSSCPHIEAACLKFGFKKEGHIEKSMMWRQKLVDILIFGLEL